MTDREKQFIEGFAEGYSRFGETHLMGRIMAILLLSEDPLSLDEISERLGVSKGPVSTEARKLEMLFTVKKVKKPGDRKVFYQPVEDPFISALDRNIHFITANLEIAESWLENEEIDKEGKAYIRIKQMKNFYSNLISCMMEFSEKWKKGGFSE